MTDRHSADYEAAYEAVLTLLADRYPTKRPAENTAAASVIATLIEDGVLIMVQHNDGTDGAK